MDKELKVKWVAALRSGKFEQTRNVLRGASGGFCCLGVLLDVSSLGGHWERGGVYSTPEYEIEADLCRLRENLGISVEAHNKLVHMNDGERGERQHSFAEIADWIEANL